MSYTDAEALPVANDISCLPSVAAAGRGQRNVNGDETAEGQEPSEFAAYRPLLDGKMGRNGIHPSERPIRMWLEVQAASPCQSVTCRDLSESG